MQDVVTEKKLRLDFTSLSVPRSLKIGVFKTLNLPINLTMLSKAPSLDVVIILISSRREIACVEMTQRHCASNLAIALL